MKYFLSSSSSSSSAIFFFEFKFKFVNKRPSSSSSSLHPCFTIWLKIPMTKNMTHCRRLKSIHFRSDTNRTGAEGLCFYYPRLLHCLNQNQMLAVVLLSQHRVSSSKAIRPRAPCGARCIGHDVRTWSAVFSEAPHSQFGV